MFGLMKFAPAFEENVSLDARAFFLKLYIDPLGMSEELPSSTPYMTICWSAVPTVSSAE
jgi:hypothetical protein